MAEFRDSTAATTKEAAQKWVATRLRDSGYLIARIVTDKAADAKGQPVPVTTVTSYGQGYDYYAVYFFCKEENTVQFAGFWDFKSIDRGQSAKFKYTTFWNNKRLGNLPVKPAKYELKADPQPRRVVAEVVPVPAVQPVPAYFDLEVTGAWIRDADFERAVIRRAAAYTPTDTPDIEFMKLSTPDAIVDNKLSFVIGSLSSPRRDWIQYEKKLLAVRLLGCTTQTKMTLYQQLLPEARKRFQLHKPASGARSEFDERGYETMLMSDKPTEIDIQLKAFGPNNTYIEMPFEEVPKKAMFIHEVLLFKGTAFVPSFLLDDIIVWNYARKLEALPLAPKLPERRVVMVGPYERKLPAARKEKKKDPRLQALLRLWDSLVPSAALMPTIPGVPIPDIKKLVKPDCVTAVLQEYPDINNRKFLSNYLARLSLPIALVFKPLAGPIARKYQRNAPQKQVQIERELKQWYAKSKTADFHSCEQLLMNGKCPFFKPGMKPLDAIGQCWGNLQVQGKKTPMAFTRAHA